MKGCRCVIEASMIDVSSNCSRVDAVKALANQLKTQYVAPPTQVPADDKSRKVQSDLQTLDNQIKTGDAKKAEAALAVARKDLTLTQNETAHSSPAGIKYGRRLDAYA
jgi:hypothetical protein